MLWDAITLTWDLSNSLLSVNGVQQEDLTSPALFSLETGGLIAIYYIVHGTLEKNRRNPTNLRDSFIFLPIGLQVLGLNSIGTDNNNINKRSLITLLVV